jgi:hypothetical protein
METLNAWGLGALCLNSRSAAFFTYRKRACVHARVCTCLCACACVCARVRACTYVRVLARVKERSCGQHGAAANQGRACRVPSSVLVAFTKKSVTLKPCLLKDTHHTTQNQDNNKKTANLVSKGQVSSPLPRGTATLACCCPPNCCAHCSHVPIHRVCVFEKDGQGQKE